MWCWNSMTSFYTPKKIRIIVGRKTLKSIVTKCFICKIFQTNNFVTIDVALPKQWVRDGHTFEVTGIDVSDICVYESNNIYIAVHLELVYNLMPTFKISDGLFRK